MSKRRATHRLVSTLILSAAAVTSPTGAWAQVATLDLLGRLTDLESRNAASDASLLALRTQTSGNASALAGQQSAVATLGANVGSLGTGLNSLRSTVNTLDAGLDAAKGRIDSLANTVTTDSQRLDATIDGMASVSADLSDLRANLLDGVDLGLIDAGDIDDLGDVVVTINHQGSVITNNIKEVREVRTDVSDIRVHDKLQDTRLDADQKILVSHEAALKKNSADIEVHETLLAEHAAHMEAQDLQMSRSTKAIAANGQAINALAGRMDGMMDDMRSELDSHDRRIEKASEGVAMALAMKSPAVPDSKNFALSGSFGAFDSHTALALAGGVRATETIQLDAGLAVGLDRGSIGGRAGATIAW